MGGKFLSANDYTSTLLEWGLLGWVSSPAATEAKQLTVIAGNIFPGTGHDFHKHPSQEEVIYVIEGKIEQWVEKEKRLLGPGDAVFLPAGTVHASFNVSGAEAKIIAILSPCVGEAGIEQIDVSAEAPWNALRSSG